MLEASQSHLHLSIFVPLALHFCSDLAIFLPVAFCFYSYVNFFAPVDSYFHSDLSIFDFAIFGTVTPDFWFLLGIFAQNAHQF